MDPCAMLALGGLPQPFTRREADAAGVRERTVRTALTGRLLVSPARGLYAVRSRWDSASPWQRHRLLITAAVRLVPDAVVSHTSQAVLLGLPHPSHPPRHVSMTVLDDVRTSTRCTWCRLHRGTTPPEHVVIRHGIPGFTAARTVIDCGRELHPRDALAIADGALRAGLTTLEELWEMRRHQRRWPHVSSCNDVLLLADGRRENWLESASAWSIAGWGLPTGIPQVNVYTPDGELVGRPDALWHEQGVVGEADGVEKYLLQGADEDCVLRALERERVRESRLRSLGLGCVRWSRREAVDGAEAYSRFQREVAMVRGTTVSAVFRCSCCNHPLPGCRVEAELAAWRRMLTQEFERKVW